MRTITIEKFENNNNEENTNVDIEQNTSTNMNSNTDVNSSTDDIIDLEETTSLPQSNPQITKDNNKLIDLKKTATEKYVETLCNGTPEQIEEKCRKMTSKNCKLTKCCVLLNNKKCVSGSETGPTFLTDKNNNKIQFDNYIYNNKCYGNNCK